MTYDQIRPSQTVTNIDATIAQHGALRVLCHAIGALFTLPPSRPPPTPLSGLDDHLRRDIGLPPLHATGPAISPFLR
ncbi:MAG: hypothetical protein AAFY06_08800 [Pseudomonadota bacterium]